MSYDLTIAAHEKPEREMVEAWARENGLEVVAADDGRSFTLERPGKGEAGYVCEVWGPDPAEAEDFAEELAGACLLPSWMLQVSVPYSVPKANQALARSLARHLAQSTSGAAFDPQAEKLLWPRGKQNRTPSRPTETETSVLRLDWFVAPSRWRDTTEQFVPLIATRAPEALPMRYGSWEPPPHRFDRSNPEPFAKYLAESEDGDGFWYASRPSFGGSFHAPWADKYAKGEDERFRVGRLEVSFDANLVAADERWRESIVALFARGAELFGAFFAAAQVEPGWIVTRNNRLFARADSIGQGEHFLRGRLWQGLPPVPVWLSWYGGPYRDLVRDALQRGVETETGSKQGRLRRILDRAEQPNTAKAVVEERATGILVRLSEGPAPRTSLQRLPLPDELTYRERRAIEYPGGGRRSDPAQPEDRARVIPSLEVDGQPP
ncbi:MAG TPA: hypothetical protein VLF14_01595 [Candidatus Binatia bacterium]|nr:hypothetical protein [Candidatus Binatia bacterium]